MTHLHVCGSYEEKIWVRISNSASWLADCVERVVNRLRSHRGCGRTRTGTKTPDSIPEWIRCSCVNKCHQPISKKTRTRGIICSTYFLLKVSKTKIDRSQTWKYTLVAVAVRLYLFCSVQFIHLHVDEDATVKLLPKHKPASNRK